MLANHVRDLAPKCVDWDTDQRQLYATDWTCRYATAMCGVAFPRIVDDVVAVVRWASANSVGLVPSGGRTGLSGGAVASGGEVVLTLEKMRRVVAFDDVDRTLTVEAGVTTQQVQEEASSRGLFYPVDFASRGSSQIGGNLATNAGGIKVLRYGLTRNWVTGMKVVTGTGAVLDLNRGLVKNATGYDLRHLFIGSEGTLGVIVEATLQLTDPPPQEQVIVLAVPGLDALMQVFATLRARLVLSAFEFFDGAALAHVTSQGAQAPFATTAPYYLLAEFDEDEAAALAAFETLAEEGLVLDGVIGNSLGQNAELWRLREGITESLARYAPYKNDISVRVSCVPAFIERMQALFAREYPDFEVVWFGHLGDGNLHISILKPAELSTEDFQGECDRVTGLLAGVLQECGGSISAEHGVGLLKKPYLHYTRSEEEIRLMRELKRIFDPAGILNPGKLLP